MSAATAVMAPIEAGGARTASKVLHDRDVKHRDQPADAAL